VSPAAADDSATAAEREALATPPPLVLPSSDTAGPQAAQASDSRASAAPATRAYPDFLPKEAIATLRLIERGGPYPYRQDDGVFQNRERRLPPQPRGYYREYTVKTPGSPDRGARRIVAGEQPPVEFFYTDDHYRSFRRFTLARAAAGDGTGR
jgi:guanyl-specific ribonuclease Sa